MRCIAAAVISLAIAAVITPAAAQYTAPRPNAPPPDNSSPSAGRLERLEQQVTDLQGVVAAVETLAKSNSGGGSGYAAAAGGASSEQVRQLSEQIADLTQRLERLEARLSANAAPAAGQQPRQQATFGATPANGFEDKEQLPPLNAPAQTPPDRYAARPSFTPPPSQPVATLPPAPSQQRPYGSDPTAALLPPTAPRPSPAQASTPAATGPARTLFDQGYGALNRREYSAAETYFQQFLDQYPTDPQAGSAQYWLGETAFVSGEYKSAADRFLKTFTNYPTNERAPEALLKLAISLRRLGENSAACDSFAELARRFPQAPKTVVQRADAEKRRANCT
jgi:tol-pal system protein YbgF